MTSINRRRLLFTGATIAATAAAATLAALPTSAARNTSTGSSGDVVVRWNSATERWAPRPAGAPFGVVFLSTNDASATAPTDPNNTVGDVWRRHPDAVAV
jgi:hypothetical protein